MAEAQAQTGRTKIHSGWIVVGMSFVALMVAAGIRSAPTVLIVPLQEEFGWSRATISLAIAIQLLLYGLVGPFSAGCIDRFGLRKTLVGALLLTLIGIGSAAAAYGAGLLHTDIGNYNAAFIGAGGLCMVAALLSLRIGVGRTPRAQRPVLATAET